MCEEFEPRDFHAADLGSKLLLISGEGNPISHVRTPLTNLDLAAKVFLKAIFLTTECRMLSSYEIRVISLAANVDIRTLRRVLSGGKVQPAVYWRVAKELRTRRLEHLLPNGLPLTLVAS